MRVSRLAGHVGILALVGAAGLARADGVQPAPVLRWASGDATLERGLDLLQGDDAALTDAMRREQRLVLALGRPMDRAARAALANAGAAVLEYLPERALLVDVRDSDTARLRALHAQGLVRGVFAFAPEWKLDARLREAPRMGKAAPVRAEAWFFAGIDEASAAGLAARVAEVRVVSSGAAGDRAIVVVEATPAGLAGLARVAGVRFIEPTARFDVRSNVVTSWVVQTNQTGQTPLYARGLTGSGQIMGIVDDPFSPEHCAFRDAVNPIGPDHRKIVAYNSPVFSIVHGTHVSATAVGDPGFPGDNRGLAYGARMAFHWLPFSIAEVYGRFDLHRTQGASVHTNSWGNSSTTSYDGTCVAIDEFSRLFEDQLIVFAVSNGATIANPENAKNALAVSAGGSPPNQDQMCNQLGTGPGAGPTNDGRRKPEVVAPGCFITSATGSACGQTTLSGTSMATPAVSAMALLARDYFVRGFYPGGTASAGSAFVPSGALLRAIVVNSARDMTGVAGYPNNREGWGRVTIDDALFFAGDARRLVLRDVRSDAPAALDGGESGLVRVRVTDAGLPLRATLAFTDPAGALGATNPVVNNLDLLVTAPDGTVYRGNNFAGGVSAPGGSADGINTIEQVLLTAPTPGVYSVSIVGSTVSVGPQGYALVVTGAVNEDVCDGLDFNQDGDFPTPLDLEDFINAVAGNPCATCSSDLDFNNDGDFPTPLDIEAFINVSAGGACL